MDCIVDYLEAENAHNFRLRRIAREDGDTWLQGRRLVSEPVDIFERLPFESLVRRSVPSDLNRRHDLMFIRQYHPLIWVDSKPLCRMC